MLSFSLYRLEFPFAWNIRENEEMSGKVGTVLFNKSVPTSHKLMAIQWYSVNLFIYKINNHESYFPKAIKVDQTAYFSN